MRVLVGYVSETKEQYARLLPIGCGYLHAAITAAGHDSLLVNFSDMSGAQREAVIREQNPHVVFLSQFTHNRHLTVALAGLIKHHAPNTLVVLGGPHATFTAEDQLARQEVDVVVIGEGEETVVSLIETVVIAGDLSGVSGIVYRRGGKVLRTPPRPVIAELDALPFPATYAGMSRGVNLRQQLEFIITSRGCPASCTFCSSPSFWGRRIRYRSPESVVAEIRYLRDSYGLIYFSIRDDTFTCSKERVIRFCKKLLEERIFVLWNCQSRVNAVDAETLAWMKRAGCEAIQYGVESGSERVLKRMSKSISLTQAREAARITCEAGIKLSIYLITGIWGEDDVDLRSTLSLVDELRADDGQVSPLVYYPGTVLFREAVENGWVPRALFADEKGESFPVRTDPFVTSAMKKILQKLQTVGERQAVAPDDYRRIRKKLGYTHVGNVMQGESCLAAGNVVRARDLFQEIVRVQPDNPWGWLMMAELHAGLGQFDKAVAEYREMLRLVPRHAPGYAALAEIYSAVGDTVGAVDCLRKVAELDPWDDEARKAMIRVEGKRKKAKH